MHSTVNGCVCTVIPHIISVTSHLVGQGQNAKALYIVHCGFCDGVYSLAAFAA